MPRVERSSDSGVETREEKEEISEVNGLSGRREIGV